MIVCSCNVLSDHDVRHVVNSADNSPRSAKQLYNCLGCSVECGRCARTIKGLIDEALASCGSSSWKSLGSPVLTPEVQKRLVDSVHAEVGPHTSRSSKPIETRFCINLPETVAHHEVAAFCCA